MHDLIMTPTSMMELLLTGNAKTVEEEWLQLTENETLELPTLRGYAPVLEKLRKAGDNALAETLAWSAIESIKSRCSEEETLSIAGPFLLAVGKSDELRTQVAELYRSVYSSAEGLEQLMQEAGIAGGRPVRRALRTLDVCLSLKEGSFLVGRDEDEAARVERIDVDAWEVEITVGRKQETLEAVHLADRFRLADEDDFTVLRHFDQERLTKRLAGDPAAVVIDICRSNGDTIDSVALKERFVPSVFDEDAWKKWWTRARAALKRVPNIVVEGRSPYYITVSDVEIHREAMLLDEVQKQRDPRGLLSNVQSYLRDCKGQGKEPDQNALEQCYKQIRERAQDRADLGSPFAGILWLTARFVGEKACVAEAQEGAVDYIRGVEDLTQVVGSLKNDDLVEGFCACLKEAWPDDWQSRLLSLLPLFPPRSCGHASVMLVEGGCSPADLEGLVQRILADAIRHFDALLWLWDGASVPQNVQPPTPTVLLGRVLRALEDVSTSESYPPDCIRDIKSRVRSLLGARKFERFRDCLEDMDEGTARTIRRRVSRNDMLGPSVREDLLRQLDERFPPVKQGADVPLWGREDVVFVTAKGMSRKSAEIDEHINVKMKENSIAIGRAAEHGDLSENSEYKFALEERDLLRARLGQMNEEFAKAEVIVVDEVPTDSVGIGSRAVFHRVTDGAVESMVFAGGWDADLSIGWYNYQSPLAQRLMGLKVGDQVELDHGDAKGTYKLAEIQNALLD